METQFVGETSSLRPARHQVIEFLESQGVDAAVVQQAALVLSELTTNAVEASPGRDYRVVIDIDDALRISVVNSLPDDSVPQREDWGPTSLLAPRGRGLTIIEHLADRVEIDESDRLVSITAYLAL